MTCSACGHDNPEHAKFCAECGQGLALRCPSCDAELIAGSRFCNQCGATISASPAGASATAASSQTALPERKPSAYTPKHLAEKILQSRAALEGERKQVTVLFADIKGSMSLAAQLDPEDWHRLLERFFAILGDAVHRYEGTVNQYTGDGIMALFGAPIAHEDHAQRACYAALQMRDELHRFSVDLRLQQGLDFGARIGINSGDVVVGKIGDDLRMDYTAQGETVGIAQRLEQLAESGRVYISEHTAHLVAGYFELSDLGAAKISGSKQTLGVFDLDAPTQARTRLQVSRARGLTQFVGRGDEMQTLNNPLERAKSGHGQVVGVMGEPGLGKSRLCYEFAERCRAQGIALYEGHCPSYGTTIPFIPILQLLRSYFDISERDKPVQARQKIAGNLLLLDSSLQDALPTVFEFLGVADPERPAPPLDAEVRRRQLFSMLHKVVRAQNELGVASVTMVDDLHWVDSWSDEFIAQMVEAFEHSHGLLLVNFRPEYQAAWSNKPHYQQLPLVPLGEDAVGEMVASLLGDDQSVVALTKKIMAWTRGNPLYSEEVINTLVETGQLEGARGAYHLTREVSALEVPASVHAIIAARIDRLDEHGKALLHAASVIGKEFSRPLIERIGGLDAAQFSATLERLKSGDFIFETALYPTVEYSFKHPLVHEVAYDKQLRDKREQQHAAAAAGIEALEPERLDELASMLAYHWERANDAANALTWHQRAAYVSGLNDPKSALEHWRKVRSLVDGLEPEPEILSAGARACGQIINIQWRTGGDEAQAEKDFEDGCALAERAGNDTLIAALTGSYASMRGVALGDATGYARLTTEAVRLADRTDDHELQHCMRQFQVWGYLFSGRIGDALDIAKAVLDAIPKDEDYGTRYAFPPIRWTTLMGSATALSLLGQYGPSRALFDQGYDATQDVPEMLATAASLDSIMCGLYGDFGRASNSAQTAMTAAENGGTGYARQMARDAMGRNLLQSGDFARASEMALDAMAIAQEENTGGSHHGSIGSLLAEAQIGLGAPDQARATVEATIVFCNERGLIWDLAPWFALTNACTRLHDRDAAFDSLARTATLVEQTGSLIYQPYLHEARARFAATFNDGWDGAAEQETALGLFANLGANGHVERLRASSA